MAGITPVNHLIVIGNRRAHESVGIRPMFLGDEVNPLLDQRIFLRAERLVLSDQDMAKHHHKHLTMGLHDFPFGRIREHSLLRLTARQLGTEGLADEICQAKRVIDELIVITVAQVKG